MLPSDRAGLGKVRQTVPPWLTSSDTQTHTHTDREHFDQLIRIAQPTGLKM